MATFVTLDEAKAQVSELIERAVEVEDVVIVAADGRRVWLVPVNDEVEMGRS